MKVIVTRIMEDGRRVKPCEEAYEGLVHMYKYSVFYAMGFDSQEEREEYRQDLIDRGCRDLVLISDKYGEKWRGTEIEPTKVWLVDFNTVEEVVAVVYKYADFVVNEKGGEEALFTVEIYDSYPSIGGYLSDYY